MKSYHRIIQLLTLFMFIICLSSHSMAEVNDIGTMVTIKGKAVIERNKKTFHAKVRDALFLNDTVSTLEASRAKMLFVDDSILTLGENSKAVLKEFVYSKEKGGSSIFKLIDGKMRCIVGKTEFEVHTPTSVAAARGTIILIETGMKNGKKFATLISLEGDIYVRSTHPDIVGSVILKSGMMITIFDAEPLSMPVIAPESEKDRLLRETHIGYELSIPVPPEIKDVPELTGIEGIRIPPIEQQPATTTTSPVDIELQFPE